MAQLSNFGFVQNTINGSAMELTLLDFLPDSYVYEIKSFDEYIPKDNNDKLNGFRASVNLNFYEISELEKWKSNFEKKTNTIYTRRHATAEGTIYTLKWILNCHRNTRGKQSDFGGKNTRCPSRLIIKMKRCYPGQDFHVTNIEIDFVHNHGVANEDVNRLRKPSSELMDKFKKLYSCGHNPTSALHAHILDVMLDNPDDFESVINDRSLVPDLRWAHYVKNIFQKEFGKDNVNEQEALKLLAEELGSNGGRMEILVEGDQVAVVIMTPLMIRVLTTDSSADVMFVDSSRTVDKTKTKIYLLMTHNLIGELPIAVIITKSEEDSVILSAFNCLQRILLDNCFGGDKKGPSVIVTDDKNIEQNILRVVWPDANYLLCTFRILESLWRWLWDTKQNLPQDSRLHLIKLVKKVAFSEKESEMEENYLLLRTDFVAMQFSMFFQQVANLYERRRLWMFCYRSEKFRRSCHNSDQAAMKIVKDLIFGKTKAFSLAQLVDFVTKRFELHFQKRLEAAAFNKPDGGFQIKLSHLLINTTEELTEQLESDVYKVTSSKVSDASYIVDTKLGLCSCPGNNLSGACKHLYSAIQHQNVGFENTLQVTNIEQQAHLYWLSSGKSLPGEFVIVTGDSGAASSSETIYMVEILDRTNEIETDLLTQETVDSSVDTLHSGNELQMVKVGNLMTVDEDEEASRQIESSLFEILEDLKKRLKENPELYIPAVKDFSSSYWELTTDDTLTFALHSFGTNSRNKICRTRKQPELSTKRQATTSIQHSLSIEEIPRVITIECPQVPVNAEHCYSRQN